MATWEVTWHTPLELRESRDTRYIYECDLEALNVWPGLYIFARTHGESIEPIYIGETENLRRRIEQHLASVPLMNGLKYARTGRRVLMVGELETRRGLRVKPTLQKIEQVLVREALNQGHELLNDRGTRYVTDDIVLRGNRLVRDLFDSRTLRYDRS